MQLNTRNDIPLYLNGLNLTGEGAEIGVLRGEYSKVLLSSWKGTRLYSIDAWRHWYEGYIDVNNPSDDIHEQSYQTTCKALAPFGDRSHIIRMTSQEAAVLFEDGQLDFVYIDANHSYEGCLADIRTWYPKVRKGGVIAGHDYKNTHSRGTPMGVKKAVDEFFRGQEIIITAKDWPSWLVVKG